MSLFCDTENRPAGLGLHRAPTTMHAKSSFPPSFSISTRKARTNPELHATHVYSSRISRRPFADLSQRVSNAHNKASFSAQNLDNGILFSLQDSGAETSSTMAFQPLPPVPPTSAFKLSSLLDILSDENDCLDTSIPETPLETPVPSLAHSAYAVPDPPATPKPASANLAPILAHPNSPYVPWSTPMKQRILRPLTPRRRSDFSIQCSRPCSRSGARAPEPPSIPTCTACLTSRAFMRRLASLRHVMKQNAKHAANQFLKLKKVCRQQRPLRGELPNDGTLSRVASPLEMSFSSDNDFMIDTWHERDCNEQHTETQHSMTVDEHERFGSWMNLHGSAASSNTFLPLPSTVAPNSSSQISTDITSTGGSPWRGMPGGWTFTP